MHQALVRQQANARHGTHDTKTRGEVRGGGRKPWRQKGTGRARQGSPARRSGGGGGVVWGPHPRAYTQDDAEADAPPGDPLGALGQGARRRSPVVDHSTAWKGGTTGDDRRCLGRPRHGARSTLIVAPARNA